jgi:hemerythrin-like metal-binding protein
LTLGVAQLAQQRTQAARQTNYNNCNFNIFYRQVAPMPTDKSNIIKSWCATNSVGVRELDNQHEVILNLCDVLNDYIDKKGPKLNRDIHMILDNIFKFGTIHFKLEELHMKHTNYHEIFEHKNAHFDYEDELAKLNRLICIDHSNIYKFNEYVKSWWVRHITEVDMKYAKTSK